MVEIMAIYVIPSLKLVFRLKGAHPRVATTVRSEDGLGTVQRHLWLVHALDYSRAYLRGDATEASDV